MHTIDDAGRTALLVLELPSGTAILHGEEVELPLREFRLLAELASRVGEAVSSEELIQAIWPDEPWTPKENLYILATRLRRLIDGSTKFGANIRNRRGYGYILDLEPNEVVLRKTVAASDDIVIRLDPEEPAQAPETPEHEAGVLGGRPLRLKTVAMAGLVSLLAIGMAWSAGFILSSRLASNSGPPPQPDTRSQERVEEAKSSEEDQKGQDQGDKKKGDSKGQRGSSRERGGAVASGSSSSGETSFVGPQAGTQAGSQGSRKTSKKDEPAPEPALPPAPTRYLYHLVNEESGDHFVTTDGNAASEYEAKGYEGGAIARVYTNQETATKAISTNAGTAYIFISSAPKTEPASKVLRLWYSTNGGGDFFYTTNESEAKQEGWQGSAIGFVRAL